MPMIPREERLRVKRIASRINPRVKEWASLHERKARERLGLTLAEGAKLVEEGLEAVHGGVLRPATLLVSDSGAERSEAGALFAKAGDMGVERVGLADDCYAKLSGLKNADGLALVLAFGGEEPNMARLCSAPDARWLIAAGVQDPGNAGALARTALATGCSGCLFLDGADPMSPKFLRGSMGAAFRLPCLSGDVAGFVSSWSEAHGSLLIAASGGEAEHYREADYRPPVSIVVGGERGIPPELSRLSARKVRIPLRNGVESLNLAVAAGIILFEADACWRRLGL